MMNFYIDVLANAAARDEKLSTFRVPRVLLF